MIGKAIHIILKDKISELSSGGIYPVVMPQNAKYSLGDSSSYPAIVYHQYTDYETSKDKDANILFCRVMIQVISNTYKSVNEISTKVRDVLDHYVDKSTEGLVNVPGYTDSNGYAHSFINNIDINHVFYIEEEDEYFEKLEIYSRRIEYEVYYYDDILKLSYDKVNETQGASKTPTNPLALAYDFTQSKLMRDDTAPITPGTIDYDDPITDGLNVCYVFNKLGIVKNLTHDLSPVSITNDVYYEYLVSSSYADGAYQPNYQDGTSEGTIPFLKFEDKENIAVKSSTASYTDQFYLPYGGMCILVYKPTDTGDENYILGAASESTDNAPLIFSHKKIGSDITLHFNPNGSTFTGASRERTLITSTDSTNYWDADYHFFCLSLGGSKNYTGGSYNQEGWYEYFNSDYNPKLTTGQIIKNNSITGNTDTMPNTEPNNFSVSRIGHTQVDSPGFRMYEFLLFIPSYNQEHNIDDDAAFIQPTDIIYKKAKDYIYNKYETLK